MRWRNDRSGAWAILTAFVASCVLVAPGEGQTRGRPGPKASAAKTSPKKSSAQPVKLPRSMKKGIRKHRRAAVVRRVKNKVRSALKRGRQISVVARSKQRSAAEKARIIKRQIARNQRKQQPLPSGLKPGDRTWKALVSPPRYPEIPKGYVATLPRKDGRIDGKGGIVFRTPGTKGDANTVRVVGPKPGYPNGYWVRYNAAGQAAIPGSVTKKGGLRPGQRHETHVPMPGSKR